MKQIVDARENEKAMEKLHVFENKLFIAEQNREKEIQKKLEIIRRHVRSLHFVFIFYIFSVVRSNSSREADLKFSCDFSRKWLWQFFFFCNVDSYE